MNEIELLRRQLADERRHVREVASACAAASLAAATALAGDMPAAWQRACSAYLECVLGWFDERDARLPDRTALAALGPTHRERKALERAAWQDLAQLINGPWDERRAAIDALLATNPRVADWRALSRIDADSIRRERELYARCRAALPAGVTLHDA